MRGGRGVVVRLMGMVVNVIMGHDASLTRRSANVPGICYPSFPAERCVSNVRGRESRWIDQAPAIDRHEEDQLEGQGDDQGRHHHAHAHAHQNGSNRHVGEELDVGAAHMRQQE